MKTFDLGPVTAYALAVKNGFVGTEEEWLDSFRRWSSIKGKPIITEASDTLTWDGNGDGLVSIEWLEQGVRPRVTYKVYDAVEISMDDLAEGCTIVIDSGAVYADWPAEYDSETGVISSGGIVFFVSEDCTDDWFPEPGLYFTDNVRSLTIPGFTGFPKEVLDPDYLPNTVATLDDITAAIYGAMEASY